MLVVAPSIQDAAASSLSPFCLTHSPVWFCSCFLSFLFGGSIHFCALPDQRSSYNCPPPPPERMSKASRPFEVGHCSLTLKVRGRGGGRDEKVSKLDDRGREGGGDDNEGELCHRPDRGLFMLAAFHCCLRSLLTKFKFIVFFCFKSLWQFYKEPPCRLKVVYMPKY